MLPVCAPQGSNDDVVCIERVIQVTAELPDVEAPQVGCTGLRIRGSSSWQKRQNLNGLFELGREKLLMLSILDPPGPLAVDVAARALGEPDPTGLQLDRSRLSRSAASTSRPASTSAWD